MVSTNSTPDTPSLFGETLFKKKLCAMCCRPQEFVLWKSVKTQIAKDVKIPLAVYPNFRQNVSNHPVIL